ncbi:nucleotidyltransferase domain-containing protein [Bacillus cereus]|uniref:nucleotidyltransferase domain-containing protein n=1 Tax=Bacillus cereus TaxID=1396 RepID=UPI001D146233|nr:nucleotidyltransferase domain-containing protein [Bacillus cereus]MCC3687481.1 nucleotidyltransferase domain-containing protein [Bacillus cereus]
MERKVVLEALTGSHNYNLATVGSDKDYKIFTAPTFEDLYTGNRYKKNIITDTVDKDIKDIRQLTDLLWKSNISYLEILFSNSIDAVGGLYELLGLKDEIARINLPQLFKSTGGMHNERLKRLEKPTDGTQHLVDMYGYNTKEAMHDFRGMKLLVDFEANGFTGFEEALRYDDSERKTILDIKNGIFTKDEFIEFTTHYHDHVFAPLKEKYCSQKPNEELKEHMCNIVKDVVEESIFIDLKKEF